MSEVSKPSKIIDASGNIDVAVPKVAVVSSFKLTRYKMERCENSLITNRVKA